jgi:murein L,D-transpeptidase YcbB/YkuD
MKKNVLPVLMILLVVNACNNNTDKVSGENEEKIEKSVTSRDISITPEYAYSDMFLDSSKVAEFIESSGMEAKNERRFLSFYNARNYQYAWFAKDGLTEQARGFYNLYLFDASHRSDSLSKDKTLKEKMDKLFEAEDSTFNKSDANIDTELKLTKLFIEHGLQMYEKGYVKRKEMERFIPTRKIDAIEYSDSLVNKKHKDNKYFEDINEPYKRLKEALAQHIDIYKTGGWPQVDGGLKGLAVGKNNSGVVNLKRRLFLSKDISVADTLPVHNAALLEGIKSFQARNGLEVDGKITTALIEELNVPLENKIEQLLINLYRMRWMPSLPEGKLLLVNIPEFLLYAVESGKKVWDMNIVVGKQGYNTTTFTDEMTTIAFSPYWNLPSSIVKEEIMGKMAANPNYLASQNMEIVTEGPVPVIRQLPGEGNSLGKVKFLFPNSFNIYFHDTPAKALFSKNSRAYSHGCIRLSDPKKLAEYLLRDQPEWNAVTIDEAMNMTTEKLVSLKKPVPVFITYYTAWVDDAGVLNFRKDIYNHDKQVKEKLFVSK